MAYLEEFRIQLQARNFQKLFELWEEYVASDVADSEEICEILKAIKTSDCSKQFSQQIPQIIPLINLINDKAEKEKALCLVFDIQTQNSQPLFDLALSYLKEHYGSSQLFNEKLRLVGLRGGESFQGAITNFLLLNHMQKGNFVMHTAGWGVGEIMDVSFIREQASIEFENLTGGKKDISFKNAFKTLIPIPKDHFLSRRFADADKLEKELRTNPAESLRKMLADLGPKTAQEIKDEISGILIAEDEYSKWWQQARTKVKKDPLIETPESTKDVFYLRKGHASWQERLEKAFSAKSSFEATLTAGHTIVRDFPELLKNEEAKKYIVEKIQGLLLRKNLTEAEQLQALLFLENPLEIQLDESTLKNFVTKLAHLDELLNNIDIIALKKRLLVAVRQYRQDWADLYLKALFNIDPNQLKDFVVKELSAKEHVEKLHKQLKELVLHPRQHPEAFWWYFQKSINHDTPFTIAKTEREHLYEALLIMFSYLDNKPEYRDLAKKIYALLTGDRYALVREIFKESTTSFTREFILLSSKCSSFSDHDKKILQALAEVAHPSLAKEKKQDTLDLQVIWTTQEGFNQVQERIKHIGTVEMVDVAKEIEVARSHGDLRENSEYKFALERRSRLQNELKMLSDQFNKARIITKEDVISDTVGIGTKVTLLGPKGEKVTYTILGPWDANPDLSILSFQSKFVGAMWGKKEGDKFAVKGDEFKILSISSYL